MKIIQSLWTKPFLEGDASIHHGRLNGGWPHRKYNYYSMAFSALLLKKTFGSVELITDALGAKILIDKLGIPFSNVHVVLNDVDQYDSALWAIGKIQAYSLQQEPFLHLDSDIFLWNGMPSGVMNGRLIAQNREMTLAKFTPSFRDIINNFDFIPAYLDDFRELPLIPFANAGILGGSDISFFNYYTSEVFHFIERNQSIIDRCIKQKGFETTNLNILFEQVFFYAIAKQRKVDITYLFPEAKENPVGIGYLHDDSKNGGYVHCLGLYKKMRMVYNLLEARFKTMFPDHYYQANKLLDHCEI